MTRPPLEVVLATPRGFCAGVERAIEIVERALKLHGAPVYVRHEIVHNRRVVRSLEDKGAIFVREVDEIPVGAIAIFSAHGVARRVEEAATDRRLDTIDATCPLVSRVHREGQRYAREGYTLVLIGHLGHPEVTGTLGQIDAPVSVVASRADVEKLELGNPRKIAFVTQTTLSLHDTKDVIAALRERFPQIVGPDTKTICYATQNRQTAVMDLAREVDALIVIGAENSSNSARLREIGEGAGIPSYRIAEASEIEFAWLHGARRLGVTAGASAPEILVEEVIAAVQERFDVTTRTMPGPTESVEFRLPASLASPREERQPA
jgi:4-hydroxy-3-methylbut-2-enyl diphosphate reductase